MIWLVNLWAAPAAAGFAVAFGIPRRWLLAVAILGVAGRLARAGGQELGCGLATSTLIAALVITSAALLLVWRRRDPVMLVVPAAIPLIPGTIMYQAVLTLAAAGQDPASLAKALGEAVEAGMVLLALVGGLALPYLVLPMTQRERSR